MNYFLVNLSWDTETVNFSKSMASDKEHRYLLGAAPSMQLPVGCWCGEFVPWGGDLGCRLPQEAQTPLSAQALLGRIAQARGAPGFLLCPRVEWGVSRCFVDEALRGAVVQGLGGTRHVRTCPAAAPCVESASSLWSLWELAGGGHELE